MDVYETLLKTYLKINDKYKSSRNCDNRIDNLLKEIDGALFELRNSNNLHQGRRLELTIKIKILLAGTNLLIKRKSQVK